MEFNGVMYLSGTSEVGLGLTLWGSDGQAFAEIPDSPKSPYNLVAAEDALYFIGAETLESEFLLWSFDGVSFTEHAVDGAANLTALPGGGIALTAGTSAELHFLQDGVVTVATGSPTSIYAIAVAGDEVYAAGGTDTRQVYLYSDSTFTEVIGGYSFPGILKGIGSQLYITGGGGLFIVDAGGTVATHVPGDYGILYSMVTEYAGGLYFTAAAPFAEVLLFQVVDGAAAPVPGAPAFSQFAQGLGDSLYMGAAPDGIVLGEGSQLFVFDGTTFSSVPSDARSPRAFFEFGGVDYFIAEVDGRTNPLGSWPGLFRVGVEPTASPALAATGVDASAPIAFAVLLLLAGGAAAGIRRRSTAR